MAEVKDRNRALVTFLYVAILSENEYVSLRPGSAYGIQVDNERVARLSQGRIASTQRLSHNRSTDRGYIL